MTEGFKYFHIQYSNSLQPLSSELPFLGVSPISLRDTEEKCEYFKFSLCVLYNRQGGGYKKSRENRRLSLRL